MTATTDLPDLPIHISDIVDRSEGLYVMTLVHAVCAVPLMYIIIVLVEYW
jgi:hypothetical protein